jgi:hypothetical protein
LLNESTAWFGGTSDAAMATELLLFIVVVLVLLVGLAVVGLLAVTSLGVAERQRHAREIREAERRASESGRRAHHAPDKAHGEFRPWEF